MTKERKEQGKLTKEQRLKLRNIEYDTSILSEEILNFGKFPVLKEQWRWNNITATSIILLCEDVLDLNENQIMKLCFKNIDQEQDPKATFKVSREYVYINFNFKIIDLEE